MKTSTLLSSLHPLSLCKDSTHCVCRPLPLPQPNPASFHRRRLIPLLDSTLHHSSEGAMSTSISRSKSADQDISKLNANTASSSSHRRSAANNNNNNYSGSSGGGNGSPRLRTMSNGSAGGLVSSPSNEYYSDDDDSFIIDEEPYTTNNNNNTFSDEAITQAMAPGENIITTTPRQRAASHGAVSVSAAVNNAVTNFGNSIGASIGSTIGGGGGGGSSRHSTPAMSAKGTFDLCGSMYKRRGGLGRNAENKW